MIRQSAGFCPRRSRRLACLFLLLACAGALRLPAQALKPGFDKTKYLELLRPHTRMGV